MAVALSKLKGSLKAAAEELGLDPSKLSKWCNNPAFNGGKIMMDVAGLSEEQMEIRRLKKVLKNAELERDILKKAVGIFFSFIEFVFNGIQECFAVPRETGYIQIYS